MGKYSLKDSILSLIILVLLVVISGSIIMITWNVTMPYLFGLPEIDVSHGVCLYLLIKTFFTQTVIDL